MKNEHIEEICNRMWEYAFTDEHIEKVKVALEKQIPQKVVKRILFKSACMETYDYVCFKCGGVVEKPKDYDWGKIGNRFCGRCGQAIDWSEENDEPAT